MTSPALEWRLFWRDSGSRLLLLALVTALAIGACSGLGTVERQRTTLAAIDAHERAALADARRLLAELEAGRTSAQPRRDPRDPAAFANQLLATYATRPALPEGALAVGQADLHAPYVRLTLGPRDKAVGSLELASPEALLAGPFDLAFVLVFLVPLAIIALAHGVGAADVERGVAPLLRVATARPGRVWVARLGLRVGLVAALAALAITATLVIAAARLGAPFPVGSWLIAVLATTAHAAFWGAVVGLVAVRSRTTATSALRSATVWLLLLLVAPAVVNVVARAAAPVPARAEFVQAVRDATDRVEATRADVLERYLFDHPELARGGDSSALPAALARLVTTRAVEAQAAYVERRYDAQLDRQQRIVGVAQATVPPLALQALLERLAHVDLESQRAFERRVVAYHEQLREHFVPYLRAGPRPDGPHAHLDFPRWAPSDGGAGH